MQYSLSRLIEEQTARLIIGKTRVRMFAQKCQYYWAGFLLENELNINQVFAFTTAGIEWRSSMFTKDREYVLVNIKPDSWQSFQHIPHIFCNLLLKKRRRKEAGKKKVAPLNLQWVMLGS